MRAQGFCAPVEPVQVMEATLVVVVGVSNKDRIFFNVKESQGPRLAGISQLRAIKSSAAVN